MIKVGVITIYKNYNYGAVLQAFALQTVIKKLGYDCEDISYYRVINGQIIRKKPFWKHVLRSMVKAIILEPSNLHRISEMVQAFKSVKRRNELFDKFIRENISESENTYFGHTHLEELNEKYDIFISGSDNIWNKNLLDSAFFLDFVKEKIPKISYAAGMSYDTADDEIKRIITPLLLRYKAISIREPSGRQFTETIIGKKVFEALDPTLLLDKKQWETYEQEVVIPQKGYILCFLIEPNMFSIEQVKTLRKMSSIPILMLPFLHQQYCYEEIEYADQLLYDIGPQELLFLIRNATYICTDSYHGTVFSLIFEKKFFCFRRFTDEKRKSLNLRMDYLLQKLGCENRIIETSGSIADVVYKEISYKDVKKNLQFWINNSLEFLEISLANAKKDIDNNCVAREK